MVATQIFFILTPKIREDDSHFDFCIFFKGGETQPPTSRYFLFSPLPEEMIQFDKYFPVTHVFSAIKKGFLYSLARFSWAGHPPQTWARHLLSQEAPLQPQVASRFGGVHPGVVGFRTFFVLRKYRRGGRVSLNGCFLKWWYPQNTPK